MQVDVVISTLARVPDAKPWVVVRVEFCPWSDSYGRTHTDHPSETAALIPINTSKER